MSLFGKILALLNMFGAVGLVYIAMLDYGKRQVWAYNYFRYELTLNGLPLSDAERDAQNQPIVNRLGEELPKELFSSLGGNPISTQVEEVQRIKSGLDGKIQAAPSIAQKSFLLARMLLPLADNYLEREQLLACRVHLASEATVAALKKRCEDALREAQRSLSVKGADKEEDPAKPKSVREAFRLAFRSQGGPPADYFVSLLLTSLPDEPAKAEAAKIDALFESSLETQRAGLEKRYTQLFSDALGTQSTQSDTGSSTAAQKGAIARLLFGLSIFLAEEETQGGANPKGGSKLGNALIELEPYRMHIRRLYVICGLRSSLEAISERAGVLRRLGSYVQQSVGVERQQFLFDHAAILEQLREQAGVVRDEQLRIVGNAKKLEEYSELVRLRTKEISDLTAELQKSREQTREEITRLRDQSENVLQLRVRVRDAIRDNERGEKRIRELEKQVRELEKVITAGFIGHLEIEIAMTFIGKLFVMLNLAISLLMAVAAFGLYAGGIDWTDRPAKGNQPAGKLLELSTEIKEVLAQYPAAEGSFKSARADLLKREEERGKDRLLFDAEMAKITSGKDPVEMVNPDVPKASSGPFPMVAAKDNYDQPLMTREVYDERLLEYQTKNRKLRDDLGKKVKENDDLVRKLAGDKDTDPEPRIRGLRRQLVEECAKRLGIVDEEGITESLQINVAVESELILKRLDALDERIRELVGYLKRKHSVDVPTKWR